MTDPFLIGGAIPASALDREEVRREAAQKVRERVPTFIVDAERLVIAWILQRPGRAMSACEEANLVPEDFHLKHHVHIYETLEWMASEGRPIDVVSVGDELNRRALIDRAGGYSYLVELSNTEVVGGMMYMNLVIEKSQLRRVLAQLEEGMLKAEQGVHPVTVIDETATALDLVTTRGGGEWTDLAKAGETMMANHPALGGIDNGVPTGFIDVDQLFRPKPNAFIVIAARPSMGKTQYVIDVCRHVALNQPAGHVAFFSLEMGADELLSRICGAQLQIDMTKREMPQHEVSKIAGLLGRIHQEKRIVIDDNPSVTVGQIRTRCRSLHRSRPLTMIVIDYLQLITTRGGAKERQGELSGVSRGLKKLARELKVPVVALSQLNRSVEQRPNKRPMMSDLRETGAIEQDADQIAFLYRDEYYNPQTEWPGIAEVIVAKNRGGPTGMRKVKWNPGSVRFENLADEWDR